MTKAEINALDIDEARARIEQLNSNYLMSNPFIHAFRNNSVPIKAREVKKAKAQSRSSIMNDLNIIKGSLNKIREKM